MIMDARLTGRVDLVICGILVIAGTGWLCDALLVRLARLASAEPEWFQTEIVP